MKLRFLFFFFVRNESNIFKCFTLVKVVNIEHLPTAKIVCHFELLLSKSLLLQRNFPRRRMSGKAPKTRRSSCRSYCCSNSMKVKRLCTWDLFYMQLNVFTADQSIRSKYWLRNNQLTPKLQSASRWAKHWMWHRVDHLPYSLKTPNQRLEMILWYTGNVCSL